MELYPENNNTVKSRISETSYFSERDILKVLRFRIRSHLATNETNAINSKMRFIFCFDLMWRWLGNWCDSSKRYIGESHFDFGFIRFNFGDLFKRVCSLVRIRCRRRYQTSAPSSQSAQPATPKSLPVVSVWIAKTQWLSRNHEHFRKFEAHFHLELLFRAKRTEQKYPIRGQLFQTKATYKITLKREETGEEFIVDCDDETYILDAAEVGPRRLLGADFGSRKPEWICRTLAGLVPALLVLQRWLKVKWIIAIRASLMTIKLKLDLYWRALRFQRVIVSWSLIKKKNSTEIKNQSSSCPIDEMHFEREMK